MAIYSDISLIENIVLTTIFIIVIICAIIYAIYQTKYADPVHTTIRPTTRYITNPVWWNIPPNQTISGALGFGPHPQISVNFHQKFMNNGDGHTVNELGWRNFYLKHNNKSADCNETPSKSPFAGVVTGTYLRNMDNLHNPYLGQL